VHLSAKLPVDQNHSISSISFNTVLTLTRLRNIQKLSPRCARTLVKTGQENVSTVNAKYVDPSTTKLAHDEKIVNIYFQNTGKPYFVQRLSSHFISSSPSFGKKLNETRHTARQTVEEEILVLVITRLARSWEVGKLLLGFFW
jgi:hypothetical protein